MNVSIVYCSIIGNILKNDIRLNPIAKLITGEVKIKPTNPTSNSFNCTLRSNFLGNLILRWNIRNRDHRHEDNSNNYC